MTSLIMVSLENKTSWPQNLCDCLWYSINVKVDHSMSTKREEKINEMKWNEIKTWNFETKTEGKEDERQTARW